MQTELADDGMLTNTEYICNTCCKTLVKSKTAKKQKATQQAQVKVHQTDDDDDDDMAADSDGDGSQSATQTMNSQSRKRKLKKIHYPAACVIFGKLPRTNTYSTARSQYD